MARLPMGMTQRQDGRIMGRFSIDGRMYSVYGKSVKEVREKETQKRKQIEEGLYKSSNKVKVDEYFERWMESKRGTVKETTIRNYSMMYATISKTAIDKAGTKFGSLKMSAVEVENVRELQKILRQKLSTRTTNDSISLIKSVFQTAFNDDRIIAFNPAAPVKSLKRTEQPARENIHRALSKDETAAFMAHIGDSYYRNLYMFLLSTGCRIGEAGALQLRDISKDTIRICRTVTRTENGGYRIGEETKTAAGRRTIPTTDVVMDAIEKQKEMNSMLFGKKDDVTDTVFKAARGSILKDSLVNDDIKRICKKAGIAYFSVHAFRDTFATRCVESGMQPKTLQEIMGHSDISMTMNLYAHVMPETKIEQMMAVNFV